MAGRISDGPADPFVPPGSDTEATLDLTERPTRPTRPVAADNSPEEPLFIPESRKPVAYRKPGAGPLAWVVTLGALAAATFLGWTYIQKRPEKAVAGAATATAPAAPAKPVTWKKVETGDAVLVTVELTPKAADARILLDGEPVSSNPVRVPKGGRHKLEAVADGYQPASAEITADSAQTVKLRLKKAR